ELQERLQRFAVHEVVKRNREPAVAKTPEDLQRLRFAGNSLQNLDHHSVRIEDVERIRLQQVLVKVQKPERSVCNLLQPQPNERVEHGVHGHMRRSAIGKILGGTIAIEQFVSNEMVLLVKNRLPREVDVLHEVIRGPRSATGTEALVSRQVQGRSQTPPRNARFA